MSASVCSGVGVIRKNYDASAAKGRFKPEQVDQMMGLLTPSLSLDDLADCDLIIEAIFENMDVKKEVFGKLDTIAKPGAILAIVVLYRKLFWEMFTGFFRRDPVAIAFVRNLLLAFFPAVILGLALGDYIELLLENAVQHNLGTHDHPVSVTINLDQTITVSNNVIPKRNSKKTSGRALNNLKEQYALLSDQQVEISKSEIGFAVKLPIIPV